MAIVTAEQVKKALSCVMDETQGRDIVALGMVSGIAIAGGKVFFSLEVDLKEGASLEPLRQRAQEAVEKLPGVESVQAVLTSERKAPPKNVTPQHKISSNPVAPRVQHLIAVASGKGGVGKSTVAANLARAFVAMGKKAGLCDADIYGSSQPRMMGLRQRPETNQNELIVPPVVDGLKVISMGFFVEPEAPIIWRGPMVHSAIQQLLRDVDWGDLDILVIDLPPGTGDAQLSLAQYVPLSGAVIVSTPQDVALSEAKKGLKMFEKTGVPVLGIIENMSYHVCGSCGARDEIFAHGGAQKAAADLGVDFLGEIPLEKNIREAADAGVGLSGAALEIFKNIAARVWMKLPEEKTKPKGVSASAQAR